MSRQDAKTPSLMSFATLRETSYFRYSLMYLRSSHYLPLLWAGLPLAGDLTGLRPASRRAALLNETGFITDENRQAVNDGKGEIVKGGSFLDVSMIVCLPPSYLTPSAKASAIFLSTASKTFSRSA
jgi:hypothetical protein